MKNNEYWEKRKQQRIWEYIEDAEETSKEIAKLYRKSSNYLNHEIQKIFDRFKKKHGISTIEAKRILNLMKDPTSFEEMLQKLKSSASSDEKDDLIKLIEAPAYRARINRLQQLQSDIDVMMKEVYEQEKEMNTKNYINVAHDSYYKSIYDTQIATGLGFSFSKLDPFLVDKILKSKWSGLNYSERIWNNTQQLAKDVKEQILLGIMTGKTYKEMAEELSYKYQVGAYKARRLINTETSYVVGQIELESYKECDADTYIFVATLDLKTCDYCQPLDGKRFKLEEAKEGVNHHPMHPHCRCTTIVGIDDETLSKMKRRARDPETNKIYKVPANMTYKEWFKEQEEKYGVNSMHEFADKVNKYDRNYYYDKKMFEKYSKILGEEYIPKTLEGFRKKKQDKDWWKDIKLKFRTVNRYKVDYGEASASEILELDNLALENKKLMNNRKTRLDGNIGIVKFDDKIKIAHSKINYEENESFIKFKGKKEDIILTDPTPFYKTSKKGDLVDGKISKSDRLYDSEAKIFEYMRKLYPDKDAKFEFMILSERNMCESCKNVLNQFQNEYPNAKINIVSGKKTTKHKVKTDGSVKEVEVSPWDWRKGLKEQK